MEVSAIIRLLICDVDGTLTDSSVYYGDNNVELKSFSTKDGAIIRPLHQLGISVVFLTGRESEAVSRRAAELDAITIQGIDDKTAVVRTLLSERGIVPEQCAYIGDDLNDYASMKLCGFKACPADAAQEIREICDYISPYSGGHGAVRDICEHILKREGKYNDLLAFYGVDKISDGRYFSECVQKDTRSSI